MKEECLHCHNTFETPDINDLRDYIRKHHVQSAGKKPASEIHACQSFYVWDDNGEYLGMIDCACGAIVFDQTFNYFNSLK